MQEHRIVIPDYHLSVCAIEHRTKLWHNPVTKKSTVSVRVALNTISIPIYKDDYVIALHSKSPGREIGISTKKLKKNLTKHARSFNKIIIPTKYYILWLPPN